MDLRSAVFTTCPLHIFANKETLVTQNRRVRRETASKTNPSDTGGTHFPDVTWISAASLGFHAPFGAYFGSADNPDILRHFQRLTVRPNLAPTSTQVPHPPSPLAFNSSAQNVAYRNDIT